ncbi:hypothetical protein LZ554_009413 [Drepanopeziza brunnea f. sp. 'monogermtubi']|nr:hypothetical protein LZ554_009413 [Drepanopeziza brunnea f. sp. 'monogermtubi']
MTTLSIREEDIPRLDGKVVIITGGSSGIGLASAKIFARAGAKTFLLDLNPPEEPVDHATFIRTDTTSWADLKAAFAQAGPVDIAVANAGVSEDQPYFQDTYDEQGELQEPGFTVVDVNFKGTVMFIKLAVSSMQRHHRPGGGSVVITASATGYAPEQNLPVYSAVKAGLLGLVRSLRSTLTRLDITINGVAPAATVTKLLPMDIAGPLMDAGLPVSSAHTVGLAVVYSAVARQPRMVEAYGKETTLDVEGRWNGRTILTLGESYTEVEEKLADLRPVWFGWRNADLTKKQQTTADFR